MEGIGERRRRQGLQRPIILSSNKPWRLLLLVVALGSFPNFAVCADNFRWLCSLQQEPVVMLAIDLVTGEAWLPDKDQNGTGRLLRRAVLDPVYMNEDEIIDDMEWASRTIELTGNIQQRHRWAKAKTEEKVEDDYVLKEARVCRCAESATTYCSLGGGEDVCAVPWPWQTDIAPKCYRLSPKVVFVRSMWPVVLLWLMTLLLCFLFTRCGREARRYLFGMCCSNIMLERETERRLRFELEVRDRLRQEMIEYQRQQDTANYNDSPDQGEYTTPLVLKTRRFYLESDDTGILKANSSRDEAQFEDEEKVDDDDDDDQGQSCMICIGALKNGDRVGDLPGCSHTFHVDCLKLWIKRRNVCPLCQNTNIATPLRQRHPSTREQEQSSHNESPHQSPSPIGEPWPVR